MKVLKGIGRFFLILMIVLLVLFLLYFLFANEGYGIEELSLLFKDGLWSGIKNFFINIWEGIKYIFKF